MRKIGKIIKKYGNVLFLYLAMLNVSEVVSGGCIFIFHQPELPSEMKNM